MSADPSAARRWTLLEVIKPAADFLAAAMVLITAWSSLSPATAPPAQAMRV